GCGVTDHHGTVRKHMGTVAVPVCVVDDPKRTASTYGVDRAHAPPTQHIARNAAVQPSLTSTKWEFHNGCERKPKWNIAGANRAFRLAVVKVLAKHIQRPEPSPVRR